MPRESASQLYGRIRDYIDQYAREYYGGNQDQGFRHWAFSEVFMEHDLSETEIVDKTEIDGPDDFEVDGYHIEDSEEQKVVHLFQSKHRAPGTTLGDDELAVFHGSPAKLLDPQLVAACRNEETKALHDHLVRLLPQGCSLHLVWVSSGTLSPQARRYCEARAAGQLPVTIGEESYDINVSFEAMDLRDLVALFQSHLEGEELSEVYVEMRIDTDQCHEVRDDYNTLELTVAAGEIIKIFREHRYRIFRLNPRGPLGNKTNTQIKASLEDETLRRIFHLLNNGLSAICDAYTRRGSTIQVRNFQIVNGCQTTVTLWSVRSLIENDRDVLVNLKLVEAPQHLHRLIAKSTNTQAPLRAEDFISTDPVQIELQRQFDALRPPWFYQVKRGEWARMIGSVDKDRYREEQGGFRWLKSKDVAQATVAFLGFPGEAKDKIRFFFDGRLSSTFGDLAYRDVYGEGVSAVQVLLPSVLYRKVRAEIDRDKEDVELRAMGMADWLEYARQHVLWLIGELIRSKYRLGRSLLQRDRTESLLETVCDWFPALYGVARAALDSSVRDAKDRRAYGGHREFFRSPAYYQLITEKLPAALQFARLGGAFDPMSRLPS